MAPPAHCTPLLACRTVTDASAQQAWSLDADLDGEPGEFTFSVVAENANGAKSEAATTDKLVVGTPGQPAWAGTTPVVAGAGTATLSWTAPAYNAKIGTRYYVQLYRGADNSATFGSPVALTPAAGGNGTAQAPFTATISVSAGSWSYQLLTKNVWGDGQSSVLTAPVTQRECEGSGEAHSGVVGAVGRFAAWHRLFCVQGPPPWCKVQQVELPAARPAIHAALADTPVIKELTGGATNATLRFLKPTAASSQDVISYRAQVGMGLQQPAAQLMTWRGQPSLCFTAPTGHQHHPCTPCPLLPRSCMMPPPHLPPSWATRWCSASRTAAAPTPTRMWPAWGPSPRPA